MDTLHRLIGYGSDLTCLQMAIRAIIIFIAGLVLIRFSGRHSFGMRMPFDNVIGMLLGAILSRAVVGSSPFTATLCAATVIVIIYRLFAWIATYSSIFGFLVKGESKILYENGKLNRTNMRQMHITEKDVLEGVREASNLNSIEETEKIYIERDGKISVVKKIQD